MSPYKVDYVELEFHNDFVFWMIVENFRHDCNNDFLCNGWEL